MTPLVSRNYRFSPETLDQIEWLQGRLGGLDATHVLRLAVAELYHRKRAAWKAGLVAKDPGFYELQVSGQTLARLRTSSLAPLPEREQGKMLATETDGLASLVRILLGAAAAGEKIWIDYDTFDELLVENPPPEEAPLDRE
jgi:hypothetical protein